LNEHENILETLRQRMQDAIRSMEEDLFQETYPITEADWEAEELRRIYSLESPK